MLARGRQALQERGVNGPIAEEPALLGWQEINERENLSLRETLEHAGECAFRTTIDDQPVVHDRYT